MKRKRFILNLKFTILVFFVFIFVSCNKKKIDVNKYDNSSFYNVGKHNIVETESGYYNLYNNILTFIDKKTLKPFVFGNERNDLNTLIKDESKRINSDAYFEGAFEVFYEDGQIYISGHSEVKKINEKNNTIQTFSNVGISPRRILHKGAFYYIPIPLKRDKDYVDKIEKFDTNTNKYEEFISLKQVFEEQKVNKVEDQKMFIKNNILYMHAILTGDKFEKDCLISINLDDKSIKVDNFDNFKNFAFSQYHFQGDSRIDLLTPFDINDEHAWTKSHSLLVENNTKTKLPLLRHRVFSNNSFVETPFGALGIYKSYGIKDNGLENTDYVLNFEGKDIKLDDSHFIRRNHFSVILSDSKDIILSYQNGYLKIIRDGKIYDIYK